MAPTRRALAASMRRARMVYACHRAARSREAVKPPTPTLDGVIRQTIGSKMFSVKSIVDGFGGWLLRQARASSGTSTNSAKCVVAQQVGRSCMGW